MFGNAPQISFWWSLWTNVSGSQEFLFNAFTKTICYKSHSAGKMINSPGEEYEHQSLLINLSLVVRRKAEWGNSRTTRQPRSSVGSNGHICKINKKWYLHILHISFSSSYSHSRVSLFPPKLNPPLHGVPSPVDKTECRCPSLSTQTRPFMWWGVDWK